MKFKTYKRDNKKRGIRAKKPTKNLTPLNTQGPINSMPVSWAIKVVPQINTHIKAAINDVDFDMY